MIWVLRPRPVDRHAPESGAECSMAIRRIFYSGHVQQNRATYFVMKGLGTEK